MSDKICKCNGLRIIKSIVDLYTEFDKLPSIVAIKSTSLQKQKAYEITSKLLRLISEADLYLPPTDTKQTTILSQYLEDSSLKRKKQILVSAKEEYRRCSEERGSDCIFALESLRYLIHNDAGIRAKLLCDKNVATEENKHIKEIMDTLRSIKSGRCTKHEAKDMMDKMYKKTTCTLFD